MKVQFLVLISCLVFGCQPPTVSSANAKMITVDSLAISSGRTDSIETNYHLSQDKERSDFVLSVQVVNAVPIDSLPIDNAISTQVKKAPAKKETKAKKKKTSLQSNVFNLKYITGRFDFRKHPDFVRLDNKYCSYKDMYLRKEVYAAFLKMHDAAKKEKINLKIRSATRSFYSQRRIWENKWTGRKALAGGENLAKTTKSSLMRAKKILRYSSMPGSSRHHWGTDVDLNDLANSYFESGRGYKMYQWMLANAHKFGFYQVYTEKGPKRPTGYNEERWHWTYLPTSKKILDIAKKQLRDEDFDGFLGANTAPKIHIVRDYVLGINKACL